MHEDDASAADRVDDDRLPVRAAMDPRTWPGRRWAGIAAMVALVGLLVAALVVPMPYVVQSPGPTVDVIGSSDGTPRIEISGVDPDTGEPVVLDPVHDGSDGDDQSSDAVGQLRMVTVSEQGGPGNRLNAVQLVDAWLDPRRTVVPYDQVYPEGVTQEQVTQAGQVQMESSQSTAGVAALEHLGWTVPATVTVEGAVEGSGAAGEVEQGDVLTALTTPDGTVHQVDSASVPFSVMRSVEPGSRVTLTVTRDGEEIEIPVETSEPADGSEGSKLGIYLSADVDMPLDVTIHLEKIGGPSAGTMFALGIIDRLTPGDLTGGQSIAGTGALGYDGQVLAIGGIRQKMWGAARDGSTWFLAPSANCPEVVDHVPDGLRVVRISTLDDALGAVESIAAGTGDSLPTCVAQDGQSGTAQSGR